MKTTKVIFSIVLAFLFMVVFSGCVKEPKQRIQNGNFVVEFLFEQDGCKMYRFQDAGRYIYWSNCPGKIQADYSTQTGKSRVTHYEESITTNH